MAESYDAYLSYAWADAPGFVQKLYDDLTALGLTIFLDRERLRSDGGGLRLSLRDEVLKTCYFLPVIGPVAVEKGKTEGSNIYLEWETAKVDCLPVIPIIAPVGSPGMIPSQWQERGLLYRDFRDAGTYGEMLAVLVKDLQNAPRPLGKLAGDYPILPPHFLPRPDDLVAITQLILGSESRAVARSQGQMHMESQRGDQVVMALRGMGGVGKSVLANIVGRHCDIRQTFPDGVIWVTVGREPGETSETLATVGRALGDQRDYRDEATRIRFLRESLQERTVLIILDDVWKVKYVEPFLEALTSSFSRLLITTRDGELATSLGATEHYVDVLSPEAALELLASWVAQEANALPAEAVQVTKECGCLPFALALCGAMARDKTSWKRILSYLQKADLEEISRKLPNYPYQNVLKVLQASVDALRENLAEKYGDQQKAEILVENYLRLGVFKGDTRIPESLIVDFWVSTGEMTADSAHGLLSTLESKELLRTEGEEPSRWLILHDLQHDYLRAKIKDISNIHNKLLSMYQDECGGLWHSAPDDGYFFQHLVYHMIQAGRTNDLYTLLIGSPEWMNAKFAACAGDAAFVADLRLAMEVEPDLSTLIQLHTALQIIYTKAKPYTDEDLRTLVILDQRSEARQLALLRGNDEARARGLLAICQAVGEQSQLDIDALNEALQSTVSIYNEGQRNRMLIDLCILFIKQGFVKEILETVTQTIAPQNSYYVQLLVDALLDKGEYEIATELAHTLEREWEWDSIKDKITKALSISLARSKKTDEAIKTTQGIGNIKERVSALIEIGTILSSSGNKLTRQVFQQALALAQKAVTEMTTQHTVESLAEAEVQTGATKKALKAALTIEDTWQRDQALAQVAKIYAQAGSVKEILKVVHNINNVESRDQALVQAAIVLTQAGNDKKALEISQDIKNRGNRYRVLIHVAMELIRMGRHEQALMLIPDISILDDTVLCDLIAALNHSSQLSKALDLALHIKHDWQKATALASLASSLITAGRNSEMLQLARSISEPNAKSRGLRAIAESLAKTDALEARRIFDEARTVGQQARPPILGAWESAIGSVVGVLVLNGKLQEALKVAYDNSKEWGREQILISVSEALTKKKAFEKALETVNWIEETPRCDELLAKISVGLAQAGNIELALQTAQRIVFSTERASTIADILKLVVLSDVEGTVEIANRVSEGIERLSILAEIAKTLFHMGNDRAEEVLNRIVEAEGKPGKYENYWSSPKRIMVEVLIAAGKIQEALGLAQSIERADTRAMILSLVAEAFASSGDSYTNTVIDMALDAAHSIQYQPDKDHHYSPYSEAQQRLSALIAIAQALSRNGNYDRATAIFEEACEVVNYTGGPTGRASQATELAKAMIDVGKIEEGLEVAYRGVFGAQAWALASDRIAKHGDFDRALQVARNIDSYDERVKALATVGAYMIQAGKVGEAFGILDFDEIDLFVKTLADWATLLEQTGQCSSLKILQEVIRIAGWVHPDWRRIHTTLTA